MNKDELMNDEELDTLVREAYCSVNKNYLREQAIEALVASGYDRKEAEEWINQAEIFIN